MRQLYKRIYIAGKQLPKGDKLGIHKEIENKTITVFSLVISAVYANKNKKVEILENLRVELEVLKQLIRAEYEIHILPEKSYILISEKIVEASKMTNGWLKYLTTQKPAEAGLF